MAHAEQRRDTDEQSLARRQAHLAQLRHVLPASGPWEAWLAATGELPPYLPSCPKPDKALAARWLSKLVVWHCWPIQVAAHTSPVYVVAGGRRCSARWMPPTC